MLTINELKKIIHDNNYLIDDIKLFIKLLENIQKIFIEYDPIIVLSKTELLNWEIDNSKNGICICGKKNLKYLFHCKFNNNKFILGSECIESLDKLKNIKNYSGFTDAQLIIINKLNLLYQSYLKILKKKCIRPICSNDINLKAKANKKKVNKLYCGYCIISTDNTPKQSIVKCYTCNNGIPFSMSKTYCFDCEKKKLGYKKCYTCYEYFKPFKSNYKNCYDCFKIKNEEYKKKIEIRKKKYFIEEYFD